MKYSLKFEIYNVGVLFYKEYSDYSEAYNAYKGFLFPSTWTRHPSVVGEIIGIGMLSNLFNEGSLMLIPL